VTGARARTDPTIGAQFQMAIFTWRWGHHDTYRLTRTEMGWTVTFFDMEGACDKGARPVLYDSLRHDSVDYPADLPGWLEHLWDEAKEKRLSARQVQASLNALAKWVSRVECGKPKGSRWSSYKGSVHMP
jgi:hypothetical protein